jgi:hypothetical protein
MAFSYSGLTNYGKATLPSVDSWNTNMSILRDGPKSIHTRRIDKVGDSSSITQMIEDSENRACEAINVFPRGVNPMVSVSYGNHGNNGGQNSGSLVGSVGGATQARLPYTIMRDGAFRPPIQLQENLLPLSRMPRVWTSAFTQPGFADFSKKMRCPVGADKTREVHTSTLKACVRPTAVYRVQQPIKEPFEVKYVIQPSIKTSATSGVRTMDRTTQNVLKPTKEIDQAPLHAMAYANASDSRNYVNESEFDSDRYLQDPLNTQAYANVGDSRNYVNNNEFDSDRYIQETNTHDVYTNPVSHTQLTSIDEIMDMSNIKTQDIHHINYTAPVSRGDKTTYIHEEMELSRKIPNHQVTTNIGKNIHKQTSYENQITMTRNKPVSSFASNPVAKGYSDHGSRQFSLADKIQPGGYSMIEQPHSFDRAQDVPEPYESHKALMSKLVNAQMEGRYER